MPVEVKPWKDKNGDEILSSGCSDSFRLLAGLTYGPSGIKLSPDATTFCMVSLRKIGYICQQRDHKGTMVTVQADEGYQEHILKQLLKEGWTEVCRFPGSHARRDGPQGYDMVLLAHQPTGYGPEVIKLCGPTTEKVVEVERPRKLSRLRKIALRRRAAIGGKQR